jgi:hypothetical protein
MKSIFLVFLICISSLANAQSSKQRLEDIEDKLDMMRAEQDYRDAQKLIEQQYRDAQRWIEQQNRDSQPFALSPIPLQNYATKLCYLIWNGEGFNKLNSKQNLFYIEIVDDNKVPFIQVYLPKSYENDKTKISRFVKNNIGKITNSCK